MRRPGIRSLAGGAAGIVAGVIGGIALTSTSTASGPAPAVPGLDAVHIPPVLTTRGEPVTLRYAIVCPPRADGEPCDGSGSAYVRAGQSGAFRRLTLSRGEVSGEGRYSVALPREIASSREGFSYFAVLRDEASGATVTMPAGGETAPQRSFPLADATEVVLGPHTFGRGRAPDERVVTAPWGSDVGEVGRAGSRALGFSGPSSFDVAADGTVAVLDQVNARVERWSRGGVEATNLEVSGGLADFALEPDGTMDVLEPPNRTTPAPVLRSFRGDGSPRWTQRLSDRTWAKLAAGPLGPTVQQQPSEQWLPVAEQRGGTQLAHHERHTARRGAACGAARKSPRGRDEDVHGRSRRVRRARPRPVRSREQLRSGVARVGRVCTAGALPARRLFLVSARLDSCRSVRRPLRRGGVPMKMFLVAFGVGFVLAGATGAQAYHRFWTNCNYDAPTFMTTMTRDAGQDYANAARYEGYQWGGGCWNYDDVDSYPYDAPGDPSAHGEGGDCSGLTFKTWRESTDGWRDGRYYWRALRNVHGPYTAGDFKNGLGAPNHIVAKSTAGVMDAFASSTHIGMIFARSLYGGDQIVEAKCEACGTNIFYRTYRSDPSYGGVARWGWTG